MDNDFYALDKGISSMNMHYYGKQIDNSMTPYILEERNLNVTQMDVFSRLMRDRILFVSGVVNENMCNVVQAQLMYLDSVEKDIKMYINSGGGSVIHGLGMVDVRGILIPIPDRKYWYSSLNGFYFTFIRN
jgi:ATP-dependent Clp protease protease subunit